MVSDLPGTTRDAIDVSLAVGAEHFVFVDTAGIRRPVDAIGWRNAALR